MCFPGFPLFYVLCYFCWKNSHSPGGGSPRDLFCILCPSLGGENPSLLFCSHPRESGGPGMSHPTDCVKWIPAYAGMTFLSGTELFFEVTVFLRGMNCVVFFDKGPEESLSSADEAGKARL